MVLWRRVARSWGRGGTELLLLLLSLLEPVELLYRRKCSSMSAFWEERADSFRWIEDVLFWRELFWRERCFKFNVRV